MADVIPAFRFDAVNHIYYLYGQRVPSITQMLDRTGWIDDTWFTEESCERGTEVHRLVAAYDMGALDPVSCTSAYKGWVLAHIKAMSIIPHEWDEIENPGAHPRFRFGGRPDRVGKLYGAYTILEVKSGERHKAHAIQTALQAILVAHTHPLPAERWERNALYLRENGRFFLDRFPNTAHDFSEARKIIKECCA